MPESLAALATRVAAQPAPVVLLDACSLLDVVRAPIRDEIPSGVVEAAVGLDAAAHAGPRGAWFVIATQAQEEFTQHIDTVAEDVTDKIAGIERRLGAIYSISQVLPVGTMPLARPTALNLPRQLRDLAEGILARAAILERDDDCRLRATDRVAKGVAPSARGKQEYKDCEILEHYLGFAHALRRLGFAPALIFVTSNTKDYGKPGQLCPALEADFAAVSLSFVTDLAWAQAVIRGNPQSSAVP